MSMIKCFYCGVFPTTYIQSITCAKCGRISCTRCTSDLYFHNDRSTCVRCNTYDIAGHEKYEKFSDLSNEINIYEMVPSADEMVLSDAKSRLLNIARKITHQQQGKRESNENQREKRKTRDEREEGGEEETMTKKRAISNEVDIRGIDKVELLWQLWKNSPYGKQGLVTHPTWNKKKAEEVLERGIKIYFFRGMAIFLDLSGDTVDPTRFDEWWWPGCVLDLVNRIKISNHRLTTLSNAIYRRNAEKYLGAS